MKKTVYIVWLFVLVVLFVLTLPYLWYILKVIFIPKNGEFWGQEKIYLWMSVGVLAFALLRLLLKTNLRFAETFSHELTHAIVALFLRRRVHSFHVEDSGAGVIFTSGDSSYTLVPVALAPYCLPIFTYMLLSVRWLMNPNGLWIFDILIGMTLCFHYYCFKTQIGNHQTDINQYPLSFSYFYIATAWIINLCIILVSLFPNMNMNEQGSTWKYGVFSSLWRLCSEWLDNLLYFFHGFQ